MSNKYPLILAIDPGASGGLAMLWPSGKVDADAMPETDDDLRDYIRDFAVDCRGNDYRGVVFMEIVGGFVKGNPAPGSAMFNFGDGYGYLRGLVDMAGLERRMVRPQEWQVGIPGVKGVEKPERKRALKEHAARIFPEVTRVTLKTADALCIADYARRVLAQGGAS